MQTTGYSLWKRERERERERGGGWNLLQNDMALALVPLDVPAEYKPHVQGSEIKQYTCPLGWKTWRHEAWAPYLAKATKNHVCVWAGLQHCEHRRQAKFLSLSYCLIYETNKNKRKKEYMIYVL